MLNSGLTLLGDAWRCSMILGVSKKCHVSTKLCWDFALLYERQVGVTAPLQTVAHLEVDRASLKPDLCVSGR